jgi:nitrogenase-stabilizing/protective protein
MTLAELEEELEELVSAEDFLEYFGVEYEPAVVHVCRLHILQRFHDYLDESDQIPEVVEERVAHYRLLLEAAYTDFVASDVLTEKVFKVFHMHEPRQAFVPLDELLTRG